MSVRCTKTLHIVLGSHLKSSQNLNIPCHLKTHKKCFEINSYDWGTILVTNFGSFQDQKSCVILGNVKSMKIRFKIGFPLI